MSYDNGKIKCDTCHKFCIPKDSETPFGCTYDSRGDIEPLEPYHYCKKCVPGLRKVWLERLKKDPKRGYWQKSIAEIRASEKYGLHWVGSDGVGVLGSKEQWEDAHQYITKKRYNQLKDLPYWGFCKFCFHIRRGGYCTNEKCEDYPKSADIIRQIKI